MIKIHRDGLSIGIGTKNDNVDRRLISNIPQLSNNELLNRIYMFVNTIIILNGTVTHQFFRNFKNVDDIKICMSRKNFVTVGLVANKKSYKVVHLPIQIFDKNISNDKIKYLALDFVDEHNY